MATGQAGREVTIRPLTEMAEYRRCQELQREAFGWSDIDVMPLRYFVVLKYTGGSVLGAFEGDRMIGFLNAMPGIRHGRPYWHSQMLAVAEDAWNSGVGMKLKLAQREHAIEKGIDLIEWTFDPLESKNAYLNIEKLGVIVRRYYPNHYGPTTGKLQRGLDSDRVIAEWWVQRPRYRPEPGMEVRRVTIPADLQRLKATDIEGAITTQQRVRRSFLDLIGGDFFAVGLERSADTSDYIFIKGASRVD